MNPGTCHEGSMCAAGLCVRWVWAGCPQLPRAGSARMEQLMDVQLVDLGYSCVPDPTAGLEVFSAAPGNSWVHPAHGQSNNSARQDWPVPLVSGCSEGLGGFVAFKPGITLIHTAETRHPWGVKVVCCHWYFSLSSHCVCASWFCFFGVLVFLCLTLIFCLALLCFLSIITMWMLHSYGPQATHTLTRMLCFARCRY